MRNSILYRKIIVLTLAICLLALSVQSIGYSQLPVSPDKIKDDSTRYVVWIVTEKGSGSGVLISKDYRLVVTNAHVTGNYKEVEVFFAVRDSSGKIVRARPFYRNKDHQNTLQRLGYVTRGRVIAKYPHPGNEPDLAMIELDGFPETISPLKLPRSIDYSKMKDEHVHILGHPSERPLWQSKVGLFKEKGDNDLLIYADAYFGNSGGPVLNKDGKLIGITKAINTDKLITFAVPTSAIIDLYETIERVRIFSIYNNTELPIKYKIKWNEDENWKEEEPIEPKKERLHSLLSKDITTGYPKISYEDAQNGKESSENVQKLETKSRFFGIGIKDVGDFNDHIEIDDSLRYQFMSDPETKKISLVKMKLVQSFMIHNNTKSPIFFQYRWHEDNKWEEEYIKPDQVLKSAELSEKVSQGHPKIRFDKIQGDKEYLEKNRSLLTLLTQTGYFDETTTIRDNLDQTGWNPTLYYQFKENPGTNGIFLDEMRHLQTFSIQNATDTYIFFTYRWHKNDKWERGYVYPDETKVFSQPSENISLNYATINYSENVSGDDPKISYVVGTDDNKSSGKINRLETQKGYFGKNTEITADINQIKPSGYHFKYNSKTKKLSLYQGLLTISKKSTGRSFPFLLVVLIAALIIEVIVIVVLVVNRYFPKRSIFSLQNNTEENIGYQVKWTEDEDWDDTVDLLEPGEYIIEWYEASPKEIPQNYPKVRFDSIVNDKKETAEQTLKFDVRRLWHKSEPETISDDTCQYHFELIPETTGLRLVVSENSDE